MQEPFLCLASTQVWLRGAFGKMDSSFRHASTFLGTHHLFKGRIMNSISLWKPDKDEGSSSGLVLLEWGGGVYGNRKDEIKNYKSNIAYVSHLEGHRSPKNSRWLSVNVVVQVLFCHFGSLQWFQANFGNLSFISDPLDFHRFAWIASSCVLNSKGLTSPYIWKTKVITIL